MPLPLHEQEYKPAEKGPPLDSVAEALLFCLEDFVKEKSEADIRRDIEDVYKVRAASQNYRAEYTSDNYDRNFYQLCLIRANKEMAHKKRDMSMKIDRIMVRVKESETPREIAEIYLEHMQLMDIAGLDYFIK